MQRRLSWLQIDALQAAFALSTRLYVGWVFAKSGLLKLQDWDGTLFLFREEYRVPLLNPELAAWAGTAAELVVPVFVVLGYFGRSAAAMLFAVNAAAVISYAHVLLSDGFEAAIAQHYLWGFMLLMLTLYGPGAWSIDGFLNRTRLSQPADAAVGRHPFNA